MGMGSFSLHVQCLPEKVCPGVLHFFIAGCLQFENFRCLPRGLGMLDVAFDLIFEQHLLGLDDKLGAKSTGHWAVDHRSLWFCVPRFIEVPRFIKVDCFRCKCC